MNPEEMQEMLASLQEGFAGVSEQLSNLTEAMINLPTNLGSIQDVFKGVKSSIKEAGDELGETIKKATNLKDILGKVWEISLEAKKYFDAITTGSQESADSVNKLSTTALIGVAAISSQLIDTSKDFRIMGDSSSVSADMLEKSFSNIPSVLKGLSEAAANFFTNIANHAQVGRNLENQFLALHGRAGSLDKLFQDMGGTTANLEDEINKFNTTLLDTANRAGLSVSVVSQYATALMHIPDLMEKVKISTPAGEMDYLSAAIQVTRGSTQNFNDVLKITTDYFDRFGERSERPLETMTRMFSVSQSMGINFNVMNEFVRNASEQFKFFGDNAEGAIRIMEGFGPALQESGLGQRSINEMVSNLTGAVNNLDIAQKAFISAQTGGPGGLQGAFQLDLLLQQGKMDEVFAKMQEALMNQFGKIVSLEEAATDSGAAQQMTRQLAFMRQGPFGDLVKSDAQAFKLLEAFQQGARPTLDVEARETAQQQFDRTLIRGEDVERRQLNELTVQSNIVETARINTAIFSNRAFQELFGNEGRLVNPVNMEAEREERRQNLIQEDRAGQTPEQFMANMFRIPAEFAGAVVDKLKQTQGPDNQSLENIFNRANDLINENNETETPVNVISEEAPTSQNIPIPELRQPEEVRQINIPAQLTERRVPEINVNENARQELAAMLKQDMEQIKSSQVIQAQGSVIPRNEILTIVIKPELSTQTKEEIVHKALIEGGKLDRDKVVMGVSV